MHISPDQIIFWQYGVVHINATLAGTWLIMLMLTTSAWVVTRDLSTGAKISRWQNLLEIIVTYVLEHIKDAGLKQPAKYLPFIATLFIFIAVATILSVVPVFVPPTGSLSTTAALATCVFIAVPMFGVARKGPLNYLKGYLQPAWIMLPFNIINDLSRTIALAARLFGNTMSTTMIIAICLSISPLFFPVVMHALGLLTGLVQAYIFAVLATVYIAAAAHVQHE